MDPAVVPHLTLNGVLSLQDWQSRYISAFDFLVLVEPESQVGQACFRAVFVELGALLAL